MIAWLLAKTKLAPLAIPIAWLQLGSNQWRFVAALTGIAFASLLMLFVIGIFNGFIRDMNNRPFARFEADLFLVSRNSQTFTDGRPFPRTRLYQALAVPEVARVGSLRIARGAWQDRSGHLTVPITVLGVDPSDPMFSTPAMAVINEYLRTEETGLFDALAHPRYGPMAERLRTESATYATLNGKRLRIAGTFNLGQTMDTKGFLLLGLPVFARYFPDEDANSLSMGGLVLQPGADLQGVQARLAQALPKDIAVLTRQELMDREGDYWKTQTQIGFIISVLVCVSTITGAVIIYQILFADVTEHLREYATLKAIGHSDLFLTMIVLKQGVIVAILGFLPGSAMAAGFFSFLREWNNLPFTLTTAMLGTVFLLELVACVLAGLLATRRLRLADPADTF